ncbi:MAG: hypothetical protein ACRC2T_16225, partial [Thermoguttaceae bacterium]
MKQTLLTVIGVLLGTSTLYAQVELKTQTWGNDPGNFKVFGSEVAEKHDLNFLVFPGAKLIKAEAVDGAQYLTDGSVGELGGNGRVSINGKPSSIIYYLGKPRSISEIRVCTGNIDQRGNQDFEVRLANNSQKPGEMPTFPTEATFTSGDKVLGGNGGGCMTTIADKSGKPILDGKKFDWVEFKLWRTYPNGKAGAPAKAENKSESWGAAVELQ